MSKITKLSFLGGGKCYLSKTGLITCDRPIMAEKISDSYYQIICDKTTSSTIFINGRNVTFDGRNNNNVNSFNNIISRGISLISNSYGPTKNSMTINNHSYKPYYIKKLGKTVYLPEGVEDDLNLEKSKDFKNEKEKKDFQIKEEVLLSMITVSDQCEVKIGKGVSFGSAVGIDISDQSILSFEDDILVHYFTVKAEDQSSFKGDVTAVKVKSNSSDQSSIFGIYAIEDCSASASDQSSCSITASPDATTNKDKSDQASIKISKVAIRRDISLLKEKKEVRIIEEDTL